MEVLARDDWQARASAHAARVDAWVQPHLDRRRRGEKHPVHDFLFTYYSQRPAALRRWHPGWGVVLEDASSYAELKGYAVVEEPRASAGPIIDYPSPDPRPGAVGRVDPAAAGGDRRAYADPGLLRAARVGDGPRHPGASPRLAAAARDGRHRRGGGVAPDRVLPLRRVPLLHRLGPAAEHAAAGARRPSGVRAARVPARRDGPLQARVPAHAAGRLRAGRRLLRAGLGHPRARHARLAVRLRRAGLRAGADRDARRQAGVRRGTAHLRRARRSPAAAADRRVRPAARAAAARVARARRLEARARPTLGP